MKTDKMCPRQLYSLHPASQSGMLKVLTWLGLACFNSVFRLFSLVCRKIFLEMLVGDVCADVDEDWTDLSNNCQLHK